MTYFVQAEFLYTTGTGEDWPSWNKVLAEGSPLCSYRMLFLVMTSLCLVARDDSALYSHFSMILQPQLLLQHSMGSSSFDALLTDSFTILYHSLCLLLDAPAVCFCSSWDFSGERFYLIRLTLFSADCLCRVLRRTTPQAVDSDTGPFTSPSQTETSIPDPTYWRTR